MTIDSETRPLLRAQHPHHRFSWKELSLVAVLVAFSAANSVVFKLLVDHFGDQRAYFVDQANNLLYVIFSFIAMRVTMRFRDNIDDDEVPFKQRKFVYMGFIDGLGTFFAALGGPGTPGSLQNLLNQTLIPCTMIFSFLFLHSRYSKHEISGASLISIGASLTTITSLTYVTATSGSKISTAACIIYFTSNIPMAFSAVYKEIGFKNSNLDVYVLTFWVSLYQLIVSFLFAPLQSIPGMGGVPLNKIVHQMTEGFQFILSDSTAILLLFVYFGANFGYSVLGLEVTKRFSAVLTLVSAALRLPVVQLIFSTCAIIGRARCEHIDVFLMIGLCLVVIGFILYSIGRRRRLKHLAKARRDSIPHVPSSFQDRIVGMGAAWREDPEELASKAS